MRSKCRTYGPEGDLTLFHSIKNSFKHYNVLWLHPC
uniref:Uncharacterized protein n=1 Tax=Anguilla anguilla TaxID=7936 RepID=A0A0E9UQA0_ANGAN